MSSPATRGDGAACCSPDKVQRNPEPSIRRDPSLPDCANAPSRLGLLLENKIVLLCHPVPSRVIEAMRCTLQVTKGGRQ